MKRTRRMRGWVAWLFLTVGSAMAGDATNAVLASLDGAATLARKALPAAWTNAVRGDRLEFSDRLRTQARSRAAVQLADLDVFQVNELSEFELLPPRRATARARLDFRLGKMYFLDRTAPRAIEVETGTAVAGIEGTEFHLEVQADGTTLLTVFDGVVTLASAQGVGTPVVVTNRLQGIVAPGQAPRLVPVIDATSIIQWCLYYPGVLDTGELKLPPETTAQLAASVAAYRSGNLLRALDAYPAGRVPSGDGERAYHAGLLLSVGKVTEAEALLAALPEGDAAGRALRTMMAAVQMREGLPPGAPATAGEFLARSYWLQSRFRLREALADARESARRSPGFGFAWARVADLEFGFGHRRPAAEALGKALEASPENAQARALSGFVAAAGGRIADARAEFERALALDGGLGNAWLGRGLCRLQQRDAAGGRADLAIACAREPNRAILHSYLGKAWDEAGDTRRALEELRLAARLDPSDPTPPLYLGLLRQRGDAVNDAVRDLEESVARNDNRRVFRSRLLLDQDLAVRGANLAGVFRDAGLDETSVREAARAVARDQAGHSAHLFLAESFDALRDPTRFNLRYETQWFNELLLANLLAPVGAGVLPQHVSQQEYSRLLEVPRLGLNSSTEYFGDGRVRQLGSQYGTAGPLAWSLDVEYEHHDGVRPNNDLDRLEWYATAKTRVGPDDTALVLTKYQDFSAGDNFQYYSPTNGRPRYRVEEPQHPLAVVGWRHEWQPGVQTLFLGGHLENLQTVTDLQAPQTVVVRANNGAYQTNGMVPFDIDYRWRFEAWTAELNQIFQTERQTTVVGARAQSGDFDVHSLLSNPGSPFDRVPRILASPPALADFREGFSRGAVYAYSTWEVLPDLRLTGGVTADRVRFPDNFRNPPVSSGGAEQSQLGPKAGLVWDLLPSIAVRGMWARSLGGVTFDETFRLEPTQIAGFGQAFRTLASEAVTSSVSAPRFEVAGLGVDLKPWTNTYAGLQFESLQSDVSRTVGVFDYQPRLPDKVSVTKVFAATLPEDFRYTERSVRGTLDRLVGRDWALGLRAGFTRSEFDDGYETLPIPRTRRAAELVSVGGHAVFNHPSGFFARADATWYRQWNLGYGTAPESAGDAFVQGNLYAGWRFARRRVEATLGVLNVTGQDYRLNPLNPYAELPRDRTFYARLRLAF